MQSTTKKIGAYLHLRFSWARHGVISLNAVKILTILNRNSEPTNQAPFTALVTCSDMPTNNNKYKTYLQLSGC